MSNSNQASQVQSRRHSNPQSRRNSGKKSLGTSYLLVYPFLFWFSWRIEFAKFFINTSMISLMIGAAIMLVLIAIFATKVFLRCSIKTILVIGLDVLHILAMFINMSQFITLFKNNTGNIQSMLLVVSACHILTVVGQNRKEATAPEESDESFDFNANC